MLRLPENPGTGFRWVAESDAAGGLEPVGDDFAAPDPMLPGAVGQRVLSFRTPAAGRIRLSVKLWREWEGERSVKARHEFLIVVH